MATEACIFAQAFIDYNLYGMNMIHVNAVKFRKPGASGK